jgi:hypothetical protein
MSFHQWWLIFSWRSDETKNRGDNLFELATHCIPLCEESDTQKHWRSYSILLRRGFSTRILVLLFNLVYSWRLNYVKKDRWIFFKKPANLIINYSLVLEAWSYLNLFLRYDLNRMCLSFFPLSSFVCLVVFHDFSN